MGGGNDPTSRATTAVNCPPWCEQMHLGSQWDIGGFHHDSAPFVVTLNQCAASSEDSFLFVGVSRHDEAGRPEEPCYVDVQDERGTLIRLSSAECRLLAVALLDAAAEILDASAGQSSQLEDGPGSSQVGAERELIALPLDQESSITLDCSVTQEWSARSSATPQRRNAASH
jgi:hypothetical protein